MIARAFVMAITGVLLIAPTAASQMALSLAGGPSVPAGSASGSTDVGYHVAGAASLGGPLVPVSLRLEAAYNAFNTNPAGTRSIAAATFNAVFNLAPERQPRPYLIAGAGLYRQKTATPVGSVTFSTTRTAAGLNGGAGISFPLSGVSTFFEVRYHYVFPADEGESTRFVPVTFGITF